MSDAADRPTKICPDCAEEVLEAARKCRFCGYRFDRGETAAATPPPADLEDEPSILGGLLVRRKPRNTTPQQIIDAAGGHLGSDEVVGFFRFGSVNGIDGIVVVTSTRLFLLEGVGKRHRLRFENDLSHVLGTEVSRRLGRSRLEVHCAGGEELVVTALKRDEMLELQLMLRPPGS
ncbi:zinc ribbon domain-containing protein [Capillimicrobium parvum]|uniref:UPF0547 domain-containing protein n=1 Tax=Capillimicrobium parvum TaxID=2884022 RepID=A0A9E7C6H4_9ACTN|nr:zinc ribbon domain-containing protein [Capillimicrobium parvum]UGS38847.1 hypothetical protein DSM104329_05277 [Capillimicrobium parvum]